MNNKEWNYYQHVHPGETAGQSEQAAWVSGQHCVFISLMRGPEYCHMPHATESYQRQSDVEMQEPEYKQQKPIWLDNIRTQFSYHSQY